MRMTARNAMAKSAQDTSITASSVPPIGSIRRHRLNGLAVQTGSRSTPALVCTSAGPEDSRAAVRGTQQ
jgi:hypothetical protein